MARIFKYFIQLKDGTFFNGSKSKEFYKLIRKYRFDIINARASLIQKQYLNLQENK